MKKLMPMGYVVYEYHELSEEAKRKARWDEAEFIIDIAETLGDDSCYQKAFDKAEELRTPWFTQEILCEECQTELEAEIQGNMYLFEEDGDLVPLQFTVNDDNEVVKITYDAKFEVTIEDV